MNKKGHVLLDGAPGDPASGGAAPAAPATGAAALAAPPGNPVGDPNTWFSGIADESVRGWVEAKGFKDPMAVATSAYNLEKLIGHDKAGRTLVVPKDDATPEERSAFLQKLGVPSKAEDYKLPIPEGQDGSFAKQAAQWMHEAGIPAKAAETLAAKWNEHVAGLQSASTNQTAVQSAQDLEALTGEWGAAYDKNVEMARRATTNFLPAKSQEERAAMMTKIEGAIGTAAMMKLFANVGGGLAEHQVHTGGEPANFNAMTPGQARAKIDELMSDNKWAAEYLAGNKAKQVEMTRLHMYLSGMAPE
jgi:hypothetical protein